MQSLYEILLNVFHTTPLITDFTGKLNAMWLWSAMNELFLLLIKTFQGTFIV